MPDDRPLTGDRDRGSQVRLAAAPVVEALHPGLEVSRWISLDAEGFRRRPISKKGRQRSPARITTPEGGHVSRKLPQRCFLEAKGATLKRAPVFGRACQVGLAAQSRDPAPSPRLLLRVVLQTAAQPPPLRVLHARSLSPELETRRESCPHASAGAFGLATRSQLAPAHTTHSLTPADRPEARSADLSAGRPTPVRCWVKRLPPRQPAKDGGLGAQPPKRKSSQPMSKGGTLSDSASTRVLNPWGRIRDERSARRRRPRCRRGPRATSSHRRSHRPRGRCRR